MSTLSYSAKTGSPTEGYPDKAPTFSLTHKYGHGTYSRVESGSLSSHPPRSSGVIMKKCALLCGLLLVVCLAPGLSTAMAFDEGGAPNSAGGVGFAAAHEELTLFEFVAHIDQNDNDLVAYGYLTHVYGVDDSDLFVGQPSSEATAKFTFVSQGSVDGRFVVGGVFNIVSNDSLTTFYYRPAGGGGCLGLPGPSCSPDPAPFADGDAFASGSSRDSSINVVIAPNTGSVDGTTELVFADPMFRDVQLSAFPLWKKGGHVRINYVGQAFRTNPEPPVSLSLVAGRATVLH